MSFDKRVRRLRRATSDEKIDALLVTNLTNIQYLTGFKGSFALLLVTPKETVFLTDFRYIETAQRTVPADDVIKTSLDHFEDIKRETRKRNIRRLGFESKTITHADFLRLAAKVGKRNLAPLKDTVETLRMIKEDGEVAQIRKAIGLTQRALSHLRKFLEPGVSEKDLALELEVFFKLNGGGETGFLPIVAFGERSSMPHYASSGRKLRMGDMVLVDLGTSVNGYHADLTRTWLSPTMKGKQKEIYNIVLEAQQAAIERIKPGVDLVSIDRAARQVIAKREYGEKFGHGLGHGLGLNVHELPRISPRSEGKCRKGMVVTIEPGIYLPGWGGMRIEDDVLVTENGCRVLSSFPRSPRAFL